MEGVMGGVRGSSGHAPSGMTDLGTVFNLTSTG